MSNAEARLEGITSIIYELYNDLKLMEFIDFELHNKVYNVHNNLGLLWFSRSTIANQAIGLYKLFTASEKHSFRKVLNLAIDEKKEIDITLLREEVSTMEKEYSETDFDTFRCKYLAHRDIHIEHFEVSLLKIKHLTEGAISLFYSFQEQFGQEAIVFDDNVTNSFREIFSAIDEYERMKD